MVVCSCNYVTTEDIKVVLKHIEEPDEQKVMHLLAWTPECQTCKKQLIEQIHNVIKETANGD